MKDLNGYRNFNNEVLYDNKDKFYNIYLGVIN